MPKYMITLKAIIEMNNLNEAHEEACNLVRSGFEDVETRTYKVIKIDSQ